MGFNVSEKSQTVTSEAAANVLLTSVTVYFPFFLVMVLLFEVLRTRFPHVFAPENHGDFPAEKQKRFFAWLPFLWRIDEARVAEKCGLDAWVLLRFMKMGQKVALLCVVCSLALFPMYFFTAASYEAQQHQLVATVDQLTSISAPGMANLTTLLDETEEKNSSTKILSPDGKVRLDVVDRLTIANVGAEDWRIYFTVLSAYAISIYVMRLLLAEYTIYRKRRHEFLSRKHPQQYSIVISDLPQSQRRPQTLKAYLDYLFPDSVYAVYVGVECSELEALLEKRQDLVFHMYVAQLKLKEAKAKAGEKDAIKRPKAVVDRKFFGLCGGREVDANDYYSEQMDKLEKEIVQVRDKILQRQSAEGTENSATATATTPTTTTVMTATTTSTKHNYGATDSSDDPFSALSQLAERLRRTKSELDERYWTEETMPLIGVSVPVPKSPNVMRSCAFVSFYKMRAAQAAQQLLQVENPRSMRVLEAPNIRDMQWKNFGIPHNLKSRWKLISTGLSFLIVLFWTIPMAAVASMASADSLQHLLPWMRNTVANNPWLLIVLQQTAPLAYSAMNKLANIIFRMLATREGHLSISEVDASLFTKLCFFQAFQMFFVSALAGSIITELMLFLEEPRMIFFFLGNTIASQSVMFITFIITQFCVDWSLFLLRVSPIAVGLAYRLLAPMHAKLPRPKDWMGLYPINSETDLQPSKDLAQQYLVFLFVLVFAPIAPLVGYFGLLFFVVSELSYKRCLFFVNRSRWATTNSNGVFWPPLYRFLIGALIIAQCTLIGLLSLKSAGYGPVGLTVLLPFGTFVFHWYAVDLSGLDRAAENLPLDQCCDVDNDRKDDSFTFLDGVYQQPAMIESFQAPSLTPEEDVEAAAVAVDDTSVQKEPECPPVEPLDKPSKPISQQTRLAELNTDKKETKKTV